MNLEHIAETIERLPPAPQMLPRLQELLQDADSSLDEVTKVIKLDSALTTDVIRASNTAYFANPTPAASIDDAVHRIGFNEVFKLVGILITKTLLEEDLPAYNASAQEMWEISVYTAEVMQAISPFCGIDPETAYMAGLLHSIGKTVISQYLAHEHIETFNGPVETLSPESEREIFGFDYTDVSAIMLDHWGFPKNIVEAVKHQLNPAESRNASKLAALIAISHAGVTTNLTYDGFMHRFNYEDQWMEIIGLDADTVTSQIQNAMTLSASLISCAA